MAVWIHHGLWSHVSGEVLALWASWLQADSLITGTCFLTCKMGQVTTSRQWDSKCQLQMIFGKGPGIYWLPSPCLVGLSLIPFLTVCSRSVANKQTGKQQHCLAGGDLLSPSTCKTALSLSGAGTPGISFLDSIILPLSAGVTRYQWAAPPACLFVAESLYVWMVFACSRSSQLVDWVNGSGEFSFYTSLC